MKNLNLHFTKICNDNKNVNHFEQSHHALSGTRIYFTFIHVLSVSFHHCASSVFGNGTLLTAQMSHSIVKHTERERAKKGKERETTCINVV